MQRSTLIVFLTGIVSFFFVRCAGPVESPGGSSVSGNAKVTGSLYYENGAPAVNARASLIPTGFNPRRDAPLALSQVTTVDSLGNYSFSSTDSGDFNIQAVGDLKIVLIKNIHITDSSVTIASDTLHVPGAVKLLLPEEFDPATGYVYIPGTTLWSDSRGAVNNCLVFDGVPADSEANIYFASQDAAPRILQANVMVVPGDTTMLVYSAWRYTTKLRLNTTTQGAAVSGTMLDFPLFVRLGAPWGVFDFSEAKTDGADIRFTKADGTPLPCEIESWDSINEFAELWVRVDSVFGNNDVQYIQMYWGNSEAQSSSDGAKVFDTANGYQGVWHLQPSEQDTVYDVTYNHYNGVAYRNETIENPWPNEIGRFFSGKEYIRIPHTADTRLTVVPDGDYSLFAWVYLQTPDTGFQMVAGNAGGECVLTMNTQTDGSWWSFAACVDSSAQLWDAVTDNHFFQNNAWNLLVGVRRGGVVSLYINGMEAQSSGTPITDFSSILNGAGNDFTIGGFISPDTGSGKGGGYFYGVIDEVEFSNVARSADWIRLFYENQQVADSLVTFVVP
jgi:hypothetical protein